MIYQTLADYYDALVEDEEATKQWKRFVQRFITHGTLLELACGSGDLAISLAKENYSITAMDISENMLENARKKDVLTDVMWLQGDMRNLSSYGVYDGILCFCDSLNYLIHKEDVMLVFQEVYQHLQKQGVFLFDLHSIDRLEEFKEEYCESGHIRNVDYQWSIQAEDGYLYQTFLFYDEQQRMHMEQHMQYVYSPKDIQRMLLDIGFQVDIYTDFDENGIQAGEKYFFVCRKEARI